MGDCLKVPAPSQQHPSKWFSLAPRGITVVPTPVVAACLSGPAFHCKILPPVLSADCCRSRARIRFCLHRLAHQSCLDTTGAASANRGAQVFAADIYDFLLITYASFMTQTTLFVCSLCRFSHSERERDGISGGQYLIHQLQTELSRQNLEPVVRLEPLRCMAGCHQPCNISLAAPGKLTYILSHVSPTDAAATVVEFCQQYTDSPDGRVPYRDRPPMIRETTAFVLPPLSTDASAPA